MAKYGLFTGNLPDPMQTFEGDKMKQDKEYVYIFRNASGNAPQVQVAAVKLGDGQVVKLIQE
jgi:hypothetical protein